LSFLLLSGFLVSLGFVASRARSYHLPGNQQGYKPEQPIAFSHRQHAGQLQITCIYCHFGADKSAHAGIPPASLCMNCHRFVTAAKDVVVKEEDQARIEARPPKRIVSPEIQKLYTALGVDDQFQPDPHQKPTPIAWVQVHNVPKFTRFDHHAHVNAGVNCSECHGAVETMDRVEQVKDLSMGWCVDCHREKKINDPRRATVTDCASCHY
jgi:hypothetical protein